MGLEPKMKFKGNPSESLKITGLISQIKNPMDLTLNAEEAVERQERIIQSVYLLQKLEL
jgi:hypothetical protein